VKLTGCKKNNVRDQTGRTGGGSNAPPVFGAFEPHLIIKCHIFLTVTFS